jgi:hypothetical protein
MKNKSSDHRVPSPPLERGKQKGFTFVAPASEPSSSAPTAGTAMQAAKVTAPVERAKKGKSKRRQKKKGAQKQPMTAPVHPLPQQVSKGKSKVGKAHVSQGPPLLSSSAIGMLRQGGAQRKRVRIELDNLQCVYISGIRFMKLSSLRDQLKSSNFDMRAVVNVSYVSKTVVEFLLRLDYIETFKTAFEKQFRILDNFSPAVPADPKASAEMKLTFSKAFQKRVRSIINTTPFGDVKMFYTHMLKQHEKLLQNKGGTPKPAVSESSLSPALEDTMEVETGELPAPTDVSTAMDEDDASVEAHSQ